MAMREWHILSWIDMSCDGSAHSSYRLSGSVMDRLSFTYRHTKIEQLWTPFNRAWDVPSTAMELRYTYCLIELQLRGKNITELLCVER